MTDIREVLERQQKCTLVKVLAQMLEAASEREWEFGHGREPWEIFEDELSYLGDTEES